ncbi:MAG TPA: M20/M25/M40 family metallo-hydrolase [Vicinamibacterales bacterium]|nr:M20/M25/M40 family metallo-hydrolase [Vicinamibacterales bacterium]
MDSLTQIRLTRELIDIDSTTGREQEAGEFIARTLESLGWRVERQPVLDGRFNVIARTHQDPLVVFSTHFDCVPPFFPSREEGGRVYGRGSCDAKGTLMAQVAGAERLRAAGEQRVGMVFVIAEERGSEGARAANESATAGTSRFLINGEPTDNRLGAATRGVYRVKLHAAGRAAHSSLPELGESAIDKLIDALLALRSVDWPSDPELGGTFYTTGLMSGGVAPNVISPSAQAELMFRTVGGPDELRSLIQQRVGHLVTTEDVLVVPPVRLATAPGFDSAVFSFTTDIPWLHRWGTPLLLGPGSVTLAHTKDEYCETAELTRAADLYAQLAKQLLPS